MQPNKTFPANLLKFNAYIKVVDSLEAAIDVIKKKRLAYGEPCVVTYRTSPSTESSGRISKRVLFGIGSLDSSDPYFFNVEYDKDGKPVEQTELLEKMGGIVKEWEEQGGFTNTAIKFSKTEPSNINDVEFSFGDIILGEASIKHVLDSVDKDSNDLVTSKGIYTFVNTLISSIETVVNNLNTKVNRITKDVSALMTDVSALKSEVFVIKANQDKLIADVSTLKSDVSVLTVKQNKLDEDVSVLKAHDASAIFSVVSDSSLITVATIDKVVKLGVDIEEGFSDSFIRNDEGKIALCWDKYEE